MFCPTITPIPPFPDATCSSMRSFASTYYLYLYLTLNSYSCDYRFGGIPPTSQLTLDTHIGWVSYAGAEIAIELCPIKLPSCSPPFQHARITSAESRNELDFIMNILWCISEQTKRTTRVNFTKPITWFSSRKQGPKAVLCKAYYASEHGRF